MTKQEIQKLIDLRKKYQNQWVAKKPQTGEILAYDESLVKLASKLEAKRVSYVVEKILPLKEALIPFVCF